MTARFTVLLGGDLTVTPRLKTQIAGSRIIAADGGMAHASELDVVPELWVGDFDSSTSKLQQEFAHVPRQSYSADKNATDGELALEFALGEGASQFVLAGATGGQIDHALGHVTLALDLARKGHEVLLTSGVEEIRPLLPGRLSLDLAAGNRISIIGLDHLVDLTLEGVRWPLNDHHVPLGSTLTLSNEATGPVSIQLGEGYGIVIAYPA